MDILNKLSIGKDYDSLLYEKWNNQNNTKTKIKHDISKNNNKKNNQYTNNVLSYYYSTYIYLLNLEKNFNIFYINKNSKNFKLKIRTNLNDKSKINNNYNYNINYINNCFSTKNNVLKFENNNDLNQFNNLFVNKGMNFNFNCLNKSNNYNNDLFTINNNINNTKIKTNEFITKISDESSKINKYINSIKENNELNLDESPIIMFGRKGWVCKLCKNFNYETRTKCNRCGIVKITKKGIKNNQNRNKRKEDWICVHCSNLNYSFRTVCNRCKKKLSKNNKILSSHID